MGGVTLCMCMNVYMRACAYVCIYPCVSVYVLTCMRACVSQKKEVKPLKSNEGVAAAQQPVTEGGITLSMCMNLYVCAYAYVYIRVYWCVCVCVRVLTCMCPCVSQKKKRRPRKSNDEGIAAAQQPVTEGGEGEVCACV